jgi:hypothetical protein
LFRGGYFDDGANAWVFAVNDLGFPKGSGSFVGFRCAR